MRAVIPTGTPNQPSISTAANVLDVVIQTGATLSLTAGGSLNVYNDFINNGTFNAGTSTLSFLSCGGNNQQHNIGGSTSSTFYNITLDNAAGLSLDVNTSLTNELNLVNGTFTNAGNTFTLVSSATNTARIAPVSASASFSGTITMQRFSPAGVTGWSLIGTPVSGATIADWTSPWPSSGFPTSGFTGSTGSAGGSFISVYSYDETVPGVTDNGNVPATNITNTLNNGKGYWVYLGTGLGTTNAINFSTTGTPFVGSKNYGLTNTTSSGGANSDGWNLVANPYPSTIDWDAPTGWTRSNLYNAFYVYNADAGAMASYINGVGTFGLTRYIPSSQGFLVKSNGSSPSLVSTEAVKSNQNPTFMRTAGPSSASSSETLLRMKFTKGGMSTYDEAVIRFNENADGNAFDVNYDALKYNSNATSSFTLGVMKYSEQYTICSFNALESATHIPLKSRVQPNSVYNIHFDGLADLMNNFPAPFFTDFLVLEDLSNGTVYNLSAGSDYTFETGATDTLKNFNIRFNNPASATTLDPLADSEVKISKDRLGAFVEFNLADNEQVSISLSNMLGQEVIQKESLSIKSGKVYLKNTEQLQQGIYLLGVTYKNKMHTAKLKF
jgi:hypothetical protein